jgi:S1-C subfamily serine protease
MPCRRYIIFAAIIASLLNLDKAYAEYLDSCIFKQHGSSTVRITYTPNGQSFNSSYGTGFVVSNGGFILTANHVLMPNREVDNLQKEEVFIQFGGNTSEALPAQIIKRDETRDLAIVKFSNVEGTTVGPLPLDLLAEAPVGTVLDGLGYPNADLTIIPSSFVTAQRAIVHGVSRAWWQTALALNPGDSGGPIFNSRGAVVGLAEAMRNDGAQLISFVIPLSEAKEALKDLQIVPSTTGPCSNKKTDYGIVENQQACPPGYAILMHVTAEGNGEGISLPEGAKVCLVDVNARNNRGTGIYFRERGELGIGKICQWTSSINGQEINYPINIEKTPSECVQYAFTHYAKVIRLGCGGVRPDFGERSITSLNDLRVGSGDLLPSPNCGW